ncbi:transglycosylase SLT domain-containing protein [Stutzerimonas kirkiae]|uniref:Lytic transglycosylase F n=1 Tax=Stutzerimonas kirkiae TaxID=2211392 RepID=A0A4Q9R667_9GAMM|nr:transglycosylase SLT domain-containing protein [Stutzerimonas kirkiae]TBU96019.1 lytic transglycosylase F [Stutzerimonas kirkiae]TBV03150.1 lytic transglycosylase F [Stutzerimonas kirkiae]TBV09767.1 lytic transglycosylase F [Stutzerimonas kirkiae]TBV13503.1 lytic transglycosylase F [Stutzerimonas kirkiae]
MRLPSVILLFLLAQVMLPAQARLQGPQAWHPADAGASQVRDLAQIRRSGVLRVLVNQSRNSSGEIRGEAVGIEYARLKAFEQFLNRDAAAGHTITLKIIPRAKDQLLAALLRGEGDMVAPGERLGMPAGAALSRSRALVADVPMVLVGRKGGALYSSLEQLSGRSLALPAGSAAGPALARLNERLLASGRAPLVIEWVDPSLAVEDVLEMVQAGIYPLTAVELSIAQRWARVMPKLRIDRQLTLGEKAGMHWFLPQEASMLRASADRFIKNYRAPDNQDALFERVYRRLYRVQYPLDRIGRQRLDAVRPVLQRHAREQALDWLNLAALAFKESTLDPSARGASGAIGLMQVTPATARSMGVGDVHRLDNNVQASARYLASIRRQFFSSPRLNERERMAFVLAAYNLGPQRVQSMRAEARRRGLNADQWFFQVERVAMDSAGMGVVSYVNSVNKYYLAYARERYRLER